MINKKQQIKKKDLTDPSLVHIFIKLAIDGNDEFYIFRLKDLQEIIYNGYKSYLEKHNGKRPSNPESTHTGISIEQLSLYKNNWKLLNEKVYSVK